MYFHTDDPGVIAILAAAATTASEQGRRLRLDVDSKGRLKFKVGGGMWSAPITSTDDPWRDA
jgi:hypothetical protein